MESGCRFGPSRRDRPHHGGGRRHKFSITEWPEKPTLRYFIHVLLRAPKIAKDNGCTPAEVDYGDGIVEERPCPNAPFGARCDDCILDKIEALDCGPFSSLLSAAVDTDQALNCGLTIHWDEIDAIEFQALSILREERKRFELENGQPSHDRRTGRGSLGEHFDSGT
jgi:hypothetical protein